MSHQHFYSRVPARVSLFNKRDGFDTFAHSASLTRDFILTSLAPAYAGKLEIHSPVKLRRGEIPLVYTQTVLDTGDVVQTAVRYLPKDFTGERSAYIAHSMVLTDEERASVLFSPGYDSFNPQVFFTDIDAFKLTDRSSAGNPALADRPYIPRPLSDGKEIISAYNSEMMKSFIFSIVSSIIGDGREVYFKLPCADSEASDRALELINAVMSILPYSLRQRLSFVSFITNPDSYEGFKLKCVGADVMGIPHEKGAFYDFSTGEVTGQSVEYQRNTVHSGFLYSLFDYSNIKDEFHAFVEKIVEKYESLDFDLQVLRDMIFTFWQCSGFYVENSILPDDESISNFFDIYEKYRDGIEIRHRVQAYRCLSRYADEQIAIPDSVFSRLSRLYPKECVEAKAVALDVLLNLIHVDLMRDSLFCFISRNYMGETEGVKAVIISNLCRVFYGGFLQQNILTFFDMYFRREPVHIRDLILDKLLLSIRTPEIQGRIVYFLDRYYPLLNAAQKLKICTTCLEMLPECDALSGLLVGLINRRIGRDSSDIATVMDGQLAALLGSNLASGDGRLAAIFLEATGFCESIALRHALNSSVGVEIIIGILAAMPAHVRADKLIRAYAIAKDPSVGLYSAMIHRFDGVQVAVSPSILKEVLDQDTAAEAALPSAILAQFRQIIIYPAAARIVHQAIKMGDDSVGVDRILKYAEDNPAFAGRAEYKVILDYLAIVRKCNIADAEGAFRVLCNLPDAAELRGDVAEYIKAHEYNPNVQDAETTIVFELVINYLSAGTFGFDELYSKYQRQFEESRIDERNLNSIMADRRGAIDAITLVLGCASDICDVSSLLSGATVRGESGLRDAIREFISFYGPGSGAFLKKKTKDSYFEIEEMVEELISARNATITSARDAVNFLLRR